MDKTIMKKVSLYMPCSNAARYLDASLKGVLNQTYPLDEVLIIDDGSKDNSSEVVSKYPVKVIKHESNMGLAAARNTGIRNSKNEFVASLDADCVPEPHWLENLMGNFTDEEIVGVGGKLVERNPYSTADKWRSLHMEQHWGNEKKINPDFLFGSNTVFQKKVLLSIGGYDEKYRTNAEDVDLCSRLRDRGYTLIYDPTGVVEHIRRDTIPSALRTYWGWYYTTEKYSTLKEVYGLFLRNRALARTLIKHDVNIDKRLIFMDLVLPFYFLILDFKRILKAGD